MLERQDVSAARPRSAGASVRAPIAEQEVSGLGFKRLQLSAGGAQCSRHRVTSWPVCVSQRQTITIPMPYLPE